MFRGREILTKTALTTLTSFVLFTGCIFSPDEKPIETERPPTQICSPDDLISMLEFAYREREIDKLAPLLANDPDHRAEYVFLLSSAVEGVTSWGYTEEVRVHQRMFEPENTPDGEDPVPAELWLQAINISLTRITDWEERQEFYFDAVTNPNGLDRAKWRAVDARFTTYVFFDTQTDNDFLVEDEAIFTIIEDLTKSECAAGRFLLLQWQDIEVIEKPAPLSTPS